MISYLLLLDYIMFIYRIISINTYSFQITYETLYLEALAVRLHPFFPSHGEANEEATPGEQQGPSVATERS